MEIKEYFAKVMQDFNQNRRGRNLRKYCSDEGIDYKWLTEYKKQYSSTKSKVEKDETLQACITPSALGLSLYYKATGSKSSLLDYYRPRLQEHKKDE